jgi:hypothetical protein
MTGSEAHPTSYPTVTPELFPGGKATGGVKLTPHVYVAPKLRIRGVMRPLPRMTSWRGTSLSQDSFSAFQHYIRGPFKKFVDWRQCAAVMQREV